MSRRSFLSLAMSAVFGPLVGCGGGCSGSTGRFQDREDAFSVGPNQPFSRSFGQIDIIFPSYTFPQGSDLTLSQSAHASNLPPANGFVRTQPALRLRSSAAPANDITVSILDDGKQYIAGIFVDSEWLPLRQS